MSQWSPSAHEELNRYCQHVKQNLQGSDADATEVVDDIRRHIEEEIASSQLDTVTEGDVKQIISKMGVPAVDAPPSSSPPRNQRVYPEKLPGLFLLFAAVGLPLATLAIELISHMCATTFFDPIPTWMHVLAVVFVPVAHLATYLGMREGQIERRAQLGWLNGIALGISFCYLLLFIPLLLPGVFAILVFGWGFLPLAPLIAFIAGLVIRSRLSAWGPESIRLPSGLGTFFVGVAVLCLIQTPQWMMDHGMSLARSENPVLRERGVRWLRVVADEQSLLRACYPRNNTAREFRDFTWDNTPVTLEEARTIYYRVTGQPFNAVPPPKLFSVKGGWAAAEQDLTWDQDQGGERVAGRLRGLTLDSSRMDGVIEAQSGAAYMEWTLEFRNVANLQREARAQIALPSGGVVSRLTLWVNGEEREAAFAGKGQVRQAYQQVVSRRQDPVLVTTLGPDRILVQCFPVPPNGGSMKIRLGITAPIAMTQPGQGRLSWPVFLERNFNLPETFTHALWLESNGSLKANTTTLKTETPRQNWQALRGQIPESDLAGENLVVQVSGLPAKVFAEDPRGGEGVGVLRSLVQRPVPLPGRIAVVVDASKEMDQHYAAIQKWWEGLPSTLKSTLILARGEGEFLAERPSTHPAKKLTEVRSLGGENNIGALIQAWEWAAQQEGDRAAHVLWIHGPQPVSFPELENLKQRLDRRPERPLIWDFPLGAVPNRIMEKMDGVTAVKSFRRVDDIGKDLTAWWQSISQNAWEWESRVIPVVEKPADAAAGSFHVVRLWAFEKIQELIRQSRQTDAATWAGRYHLVTSASGAVVLENQQQFSAAGLTPVDSTAVPTVPEPSTWALMAVALVFLVWKWRR